MPSRSRSRPAPPRSRARPTIWRCRSGSSATSAAGVGSWTRRSPTGSRLGLASMLRFSRNVQHWLLAREGYWDEALPYIEEFVAACEAGEPHYHEGGMRLRRAVIRLARDDVQGALDDVRKIVPLAQSAGDPQQRVPWLAGCACLLVEAGRTRGSTAARSRSCSTRSERSSRWGLSSISPSSRRSSDVSTSSRPCSSAARTTKWTEAAGASLRGDVVQAADLLHEIGDAELESLARLRAARRLVAEGRRAEADEQLQRSLAFWRSVGATRYIRQAEELLARRLRDSRVAPARARSPRRAT